MLYAQFALWFLLLWLATMLLWAAHHGTQRGGPFFYVDTRASGLNPMQPKYRVSRKQAQLLDHALEVHFDHRGMPWLVKELARGREMRRTYYFRDAKGNLRYEGREAPWKVFRPEPAQAPNT